MSPIVAIRCWQGRFACGIGRHLPLTWSVAVRRSEGRYMGLKWHDAEEIALRLFQKMPDVDPLSVRFTDLRRWVVELDEFDDDPAASNEGILERIQMAWLEEYQASRGEGSQPAGEVCFSDWAFRWSAVGR